MPEKREPDQNRETVRKASASFWKRLFQLALIMLLPFGFLVWIALFRDVPLEISKETTYLTEPLTADGRVDYFRAIEQECYPPTMKTDDNGYRLIVRALGPAVDTSSPDAADLARQTYEKLGLDPSVPPTMKYEQPYDFLVRYVAGQYAKVDEESDLELATAPGDAGDVFIKIEGKLYSPWTLEKLPMMADWLKQNGPALDVLAKAVRKPSFCCPLVRNDEKGPAALAIPYEPILQFRSFARGLVARANYRIAKGDIDGAIDDIITCKTLARQVARRGTDSDVLVGIAIEGMADAISLASALEHQPTEAQLQRFVKELNNLLPRTNFEKTIPITRYLMLDIVQLVAHRKGKIEEVLGKKFFVPPKEGNERIIFRTIQTFGIDWNTVMSQFNGYYDDPSKLSKIDLFTKPGENWLWAEILLPTSRSKQCGDYLVGKFPPAWMFGQKASNLAECDGRVHRITLAMLLYEKQHGRLPPAYTVDKDGKPLHSWRVLLLPYLGKDAEKLHAKIKLDEPWNSKHNSQFHSAAVKFYQCPSAKLEPGETTYSVIVGKKTAFQPGEGKTLESFGPKSVNMLLVIENPNPACWMDPASDLTETDAKTVLDPKNTIHPGRITVGLRSGGVYGISCGITHEKFQAGIEGTDPSWCNY